MQGLESKLLSMRKNVVTEALVLASTDVGEEDRILTLLTPERGLLKAAASGAGNLKKGRAAPLDLFVHTRITVNIPRGQGKLKRISSAVILEPFMGVRGDYRSFCAASYLGQTAAHCVQEEDPSPGTWDLLLHCLERLDAGADPFNVMLAFEVVLIREMGMLPELDRCLGCGAQVTGNAHLDPGAGGVYHTGCFGREGMTVLTGGDLAVLRYLARRKLGIVSKLTVREGDARRLFNIVHSFAVHHLGYESRALGMLRT